MPLGESPVEPDDPAERLVEWLGQRNAALRGVVQDARAELAVYLAAPSVDARTDRQVLRDVAAILERLPPEAGVRRRVPHERR